MHGGAFGRAVGRRARSDGVRARLQRVTTPKPPRQSRRAHVPVVDGPVVPGELGGLDGLVVAAVDGVPAPRLAAPPGGEWVVAVGPEGGFDEAEQPRLGGAPRLAVGPFVLREETTAIAAAAALAGRRTFASLDT